MNCNNHLHNDEHTDSCLDRPVEVPSDGNFDLDSFLDSLPSSLRMKVVRQMDDPPVHRGGEGKDWPEGVGKGWVASSETGLSGSWTGEKVLLAVLVAPVLMALYMTVLAGRLAEELMKSLVKFTKEKLNER